MNGIPAWAVPGAKVAAISGRGSGKVLRLPPAWVIKPIHGVVYTIRDVKVWRGVAGLYLVEIVNDPLPNGFEPGWLVEHFRPLVTRSQEQDIATHFRDLLHQPEPVA